MVLVVGHDRLVAAQGRGARTDVDGHDEGLAADDAHELAHRWLPLEMQAANHLAAAAAVVELHEGARQAQLGVLRVGVRAEGLHEEATLVVERAGLHDEHLGDGRAMDLDGHDLGQAPATNGAILRGDVDGAVDDGQKARRKMNIQRDSLKVVLTNVYACCCFGIHGKVDLCSLFLFILRF